MSTAELKASISQLLHGISDDSVLQAIYTLLSKAESNNVWYENLSDESKASIQRGIDDANKGNFISQDEVKARVDKLLKRV